MDLIQTGDRTDPSNYRPVSITSTPCQPFEYILHKRIMNHLDANVILTDTQHNFRFRRSCESQLNPTYHGIAGQLDRRDTKQVDAIVLDFAKALDKVHHKRLDIKTEVLRYFRISSSLTRCFSARQNPTCSSWRIFIWHCPCFFFRCPSGHGSWSSSLLTLHQRSPTVNT